MNAIELYENEKYQSKIRTQSKMTKLDTIIAVKDVVISAKWYQSVFECKNTHGGNDFAVLVTKNDEVLLCIHKWGEHEHPTMMSPNKAQGNGIILYFRTENMNAIRQNIENLGYTVEEEIHSNPNSNKKEFSVKDPDGYYLIISEFHNYEG